VLRESVAVPTNDPETRLAAPRHQWQIADGSHISTCNIIRLQLLSWQQLLQQDLKDLKDLKE